MTRLQSFLILTGLSMVCAGVWMHTGSMWLAFAAVGATYCLMPFVRDR